jgi:hypothetical protein
MVQMDVQQRRAGSGDALAQRFLDPVDIVEAFGLIEIDDQMDARAADTIPFDEVVFTLVQNSRSDRLVILSGGTWDPQALVRS